MNDPLKADLERIAPDVNTDRAADAFSTARVRRRRRRTRRRLVAGAAIGCVVVGISAALVMGGDDPVDIERVALVGNDTPDDGDQPAAPLAHVPYPSISGTVGSILDVVGPLDEIGDVEFETLLVLTRPVDDLPSLRDATTQAELEALQAPFPTAEVDLERSIVVAFSFADDACPPTLTGFTEEPAGVLTPVLEDLPSPGVCAEPRLVRTFIVAIDRSDVTPGFILRFAGPDHLDPFLVDVPESHTALLVDVPPSAALVPTPTRTPPITTSATAPFASPGSVESADTLLDSLTTSGLACRSTTPLDPLAGFDPRFVEAPATSAVVCNRAGGDVYLYVYASAQDRRAAAANGEVNLCRRQPDVSTVGALVSENWRIASIDPSVLEELLAPTPPESARELLCLPSH